MENTALKYALLVQRETATLSQAPYRGNATSNKDYDIRRVSEHPDLLKIQHVKVCSVVDNLSFNVFTSITYLGFSKQTVNVKTPSDAAKLKPCSQ